MKCYAYLEDGTLCGASANFLDEQRGCCVCAAHRPVGTKPPVAIIVIYSEGGRWCYMLGDADGRELFNATGLTDRSTALAEAQEKAGQLDAGFCILHPPALKIGEQADPRFS